MFGNHGLALPFNLVIIYALTERATPEFAREADEVAHHRLKNDSTLLLRGECRIAGKLNKGCFVIRSIQSKQSLSLKCRDRKVRPRRE